METTFIDKATAKAVGAILKSAQTHPKKQLGYAYLGRRGLTCSDGKRALRIHVEALDEKYGDFVRETGRVVVFTILKDALVQEREESYAESFLSTLDRVIPGDEAFRKNKPVGLYNPWGGPGYTQRESAARFSDAMVADSIIVTQRAYDVSLFKDMDVRQWTELAPTHNGVQFRGADPDEALVVLGMERRDS